MREDGVLKGDRKALKSDGEAIKWDGEALSSDVEALMRDGEAIKGDGEALKCVVEVLMNDRKALKDNEEALKSDINQNSVATIFNLWIYVWTKYYSVRNEFLVQIALWKVVFFCQKVKKTDIFQNNSVGHIGFMHQQELKIKKFCQFSTCSGWRWFDVGEN